MRLKLADSASPAIVLGDVAFEPVNELLEQRACQSGVVARAVRHTCGVGIFTEAFCEAASSTLVPGFGAGGGWYDECALS